jgi:hypothetical protein
VDTKRLLTGIGDAADELGVDMETLHALADMHEIVRLRVGNGWYFITETLAAYEERRRTGVRDDFEFINGIFSADIGDTFKNPRGFFVYLLRGDDDKVLYVGKSKNVLSRLGSHMQNRERHQRTQRIQLLRCPDESTMNVAERRLIRYHCPPWNTQGVPAGGYAAMAAEARRAAAAAQGGAA